MFTARSDEMNTEVKSPCPWRSLPRQSCTMPFKVRNFGSPLAQEGRARMCCGRQNSLLELGALEGVGSCLGRYKRKRTRFSFSFSEHHLALDLLSLNCFLSSLQRFFRHLYRPLSFIHSVTPLAAAPRSNSMAVRE